MRVFLALCFALVLSSAQAQIINTLPYQFQNGAVADATQVNTNFAQVLSNVNANAAKNAVNADITRLSALGIGSAAAPALSFSGAVTGPFLNSSSNYCIAVAATSVFCIDGTGNLTTTGAANVGSVVATGAISGATITIGGAAGGLVPSGAVMAFNLSSCPTGWLNANGTAVSLDLRGQFVRGLDQGAGVDPGRTLGSFQIDMLTSHIHQYTQPNGVTNASSGGGTPVVQGGNTTNTGGAVIIAGSTAIGPETRPKNVALLYCVKS